MEVRKTVIITTNSPFQENASLKSSMNGGCLFQQESLHRLIFNPWPGRESIHVSIVIMWPFTLVLPAILVVPWVLPLLGTQVLLVDPREESFYEGQKKKTVSQEK